MNWEQSKVSSLQSLPVRQSTSPPAYIKAVQESPYRALIGVCLDARVPKLPPYSRRRIRNQTGLTNRWREPQALYSDLLGTSQALKAINMPFNVELINDFKKKYPSLNPMLLRCEECAGTNERNWNLLAKFRTSANFVEEDRKLPSL